MKKQRETKLKRTNRLRLGSCIGGISLLLAACGGGSYSSLVPVVVGTTTPPPITPTQPEGDNPPPSAASVCAKLNGATSGGVAGLSAKVVPATSSTPTYCQVTGTIPAQLGIEILFPDKWNGKLYYQGGAGMNGSIPALPVAALSKGYAAVGSDGGHKGSAFDASFALNDSLALNMWGHLSIPTTLASAKEVVRDAYGKFPDRSYFEGCSTGGREALMTVQRYPYLFDGVIAGDPSYDFVGLIGWFNRNAKALAAPGGALPNAKLKLLSQSVRDVCDALDGIADGIVSNPAACSKSGFDPKALRCAGGGDLGDACLSDGQLNSIAALTTPAEFGIAPNVYTQVGHPFTGNEDTQWPAGSTGAARDGDFTFSAGYIFQDTSIKNIIARNAAVNPLTFSYDQDLNALFSTASIVNATSKDIRPFINGGGKLIMWHGGADDFYPAQGTANYYDAMVSAVGGKTVADSAVRFYVAPGVGHCGNGPGAAPTDLLQSLDDWVTRDAPPNTLLATKLTSSGDIAFTRPLCQYPTYPRYVGPSDDAAAGKLATNYTCTAPGP
ncbi:tannase/feruloyl esterase family alpha/beta hydrolase [Xylophilus sp. GW821-FHT01B05]